MTETKCIALVFYITIGLLLALWPILAPSWRTASGNGKGIAFELPLSFGHEKSNFQIYLIEILLALAAVFLLLQVQAVNDWQTAGVFFLVAAVIGYLGRERRLAMMIGVFSVLMAAAAVPHWWRDDGGDIRLPLDDLVLFAALTCLTAFFLLRFGSQEEVRRQTKALLWLFFGSFAVILSFMTASFPDASCAGHLIWHNWGVYVAASELLLTGAKIFYDFPVQYGFGPTAALAASCGKECWTALYWLTGFSNLFYALLIGWIAIGRRPLSAVRQGIILFACLLACFFYTAYPPDLNLSLFSPSTGGLRFLPTVILASYLIKSAHPKPLIGYLLWGFGALWSPESAFYCTFLWWPFTLLMKRQDGRFVERLARFPLTMLPLLTALVLVILGFLGLYYAVYDVFPSAMAYFTYILFPPGPLDILPYGVVWFLIAIFLIGLVAAYQAWPLRKDEAAFRSLFVCLLLLFGTSSYYVVGRSHENNVLNLMPFLVCLLATCLQTARTPLLKLLTITFLATIIAWVPIFDWRNLSVAKWHLNFDPDVVLSSLSYKDNAAYLDQVITREAPSDARAEDAGRALRMIHERWGEPAIVIDSLRLYPRHEWRNNSWTALNDIASFAFVPDNLRREYIQKSALSYRKAGWLVISKSFDYDYFRQEFDGVYTETEKTDFGSYYAVRMVPRMPLE